MHQAGIQSGRKEVLKPLTLETRVGLIPKPLQHLEAGKEDKPEKESEGKRELVQKKERPCGVSRTE